MSASLTQKRLLGKLYIKGTIEVKTGLMIGSADGKLDIGGLDKLVVRDPITEYPYIPGSSLKGKLRSLWERFLNKPLNREAGGIWRYESDHTADGCTKIKNGSTSQFIFFDGAANCEISRVFGSTGNKCWVKATDKDKKQKEDEYILRENNHSRFGKQVLEEQENDENVDRYKEIDGHNYPARLIVRDSHLTEDSANELEVGLNTGLYMTERKFENGIDRITAAATPRQFERVPKGAKFEFEMIYSVEQQDVPLENAESQLTEQELAENAYENAYLETIHDLKNIAIALAILEDDALGGSGSRGYGKVKFTGFQIVYHDYQKLKNGDLENYPIKLNQDENNKELEIREIANLLQQLQDGGGLEKKLLQQLSIESQTEQKSLPGRNQEEVPEGGS